MPSLIMPARIDLYFPPEDNEYECQHIPNAKYVCIEGVWGHFAGGGLCKEDTALIDAELKELLAKDV